MKAKSLPFSLETTQKIYKEWFDIINRDESGSIVNINRRSQLYRIHQLLNDKSFINFFANDTKQLHILAIDCEQNLIEDQADLDHFIAKNLPKNKVFVILVLNADQLLEKRNLISSFENLYHQKKVNSILYLFSRNINYVRYQKKLSQYSTLYQNIVIFPFLDLKDSEAFINYLEKKYKTRIPNSIRNSIVQECLGQTWLIKQAIRHFVATNDTKDIFQSEAMTNRLQIIYDERESEEIQILEKICKGEYSYTAEEKKILSYLKKINLISSKGSNYKITTPLIQKYIGKKMHETARLQVNSNGHLIVNHVLIDSLFSKREKTAIKHLLNNQNKLILRDNLAKIIWKSESDEKFTDWALDQFIRRLRIKLRRIGIADDFIRTIKNRGFLMNYDS